MNYIPITVHAKTKQLSQTTGPSWHVQDQTEARQDTLSHIASQSRHVQKACRSMRKRSLATVQAHRNTRKSQRKNAKTQASQTGGPSQYAPGPKKRTPKHSSPKLQDHRKMRIDLAEARPNKFFPPTTGQCYRFCCCYCCPYCY